MTTPAPGTTTHYRICPLCEACCGLEVQVADGRVTRIQGAADDVFSRGYLCPKGYALKDLHEDPDRLRTPLVRRGASFEPASWDEAFAEIERRLVPILQQHGRDAVALSVGNPSAHKMGLLLYFARLARALRSKNVFSASTLDQMPKQLQSGLMFGHWLSVAVPDIERCDFLLVLGANPMASNGSMWTVPDFRGKAKALRARGGQLVVIDPRRTETAEVADAHHFIRPGSDVFLLAAMVQTLFAEGLVRPGHLAEWTVGVDAVGQAVAAFTPEAVAARCGIAADTIRALARQLATTERACVYGRMGVCTQTFGTLASWLIDVLNVLTGHLDAPGGAMFPQAAAFAANTAGQAGQRPGHRHRPPCQPGQRRARGLRRTAHDPAGRGDRDPRPGPGACADHRGQQPGAVGAWRAAPGPCAGRAGLHGQPRHLPERDQSPCRRDPAGAVAAGRQPLRRRLPAAELPQPRALQRPCVRAARRHAARMAVAAAPGSHRAGPGGPGRPVGAGRRPGGRRRQARGGVHSDAVLAALAGRRGPERLLDLALRSGPHGDRFGLKPGGLTLERVMAAPGGIDLGELAPRIPELLRTPSGRIELAPAACLNDLPRAWAAAVNPRPAFSLIGRREVRSNNSWMHNLPVLAKGHERCTLLIHPDDAARLGVSDGQAVRIALDAERHVQAPAALSTAMRPGVVCLPHGWGHDLPGAQLRVAAERPGVNLNAVLDDAQRDPLSGNAVLNGVAVQLSAA